MHSYWLPFISTNGSTQIDNSHMGNGSDAITQPNGHNQIDNEGDEFLLPFYYFDWIMNIFLLPAFCQMMALPSLSIA